MGGGVASSPALVILLWCLFGAYPRLQGVRSGGRRRWVFFLVPILSVFEDSVFVRSLVWGCKDFFLISLCFISKG